MPHHFPCPAPSFRRRTLFLRRSGVAFAFCLVALLATGPALLAQGPAGVIEGRVFNAADGSALANARITLKGAEKEVLTDEAGGFRLVGVAAGETQLSVSYVGFQKQSAAVTVVDRNVTRHDFELRLEDGRRRTSGEVVKMSEFTVVADRQMSAQAIAMNERRNAPNIKEVVAIDEYGDRGNENIGEFLQFLPGVSIGTSGSEASSISLRGFPGSNTGITIDGGEVSGARNSNSRSMDLRTVPMNNISRVEITKVPTPDMPASGLGGSINLISRSGFESRQRKFSYNVYTLFHNRMGLSFDGGPRNHVSGTSPDYVQPSFDFSYLHPLTKNLAITVGGSRTWREKPMETGNTTDETATWDLINGIQRQSQWNSLAQVTQTLAGQIGVDWRISSEDTLSFSFQYRDYQLYTTRSVFIWNYGAGVTGDANFAQGAATGVGTVTMQAGPDSLPQDNTKHYTLKYRHSGRVWKVDGSGYLSSAASGASDISRGHFYQTTATISNLIVRGDGIPGSGGIIPTRYGARARTGEVVDLYAGENFSIVNTMSSESNNHAEKMGARLDLSRGFAATLPLTLKVGSSVDRNARDDHLFTQQWNFRPNGATDVTSRLAGKFDVFDAAFNADSPTVYGTKARSISDPKVYALYRLHPTWFVLDEPLAWQSAANNSRKFSEVVSAGYVRLDARLFSNRLWLVAGVRFEQTDDKGEGPLNDINAQYQRNADGSFVRNAAGQRVLINADALTLRKLQFTERGAKARRSYGDYYPSLNSTFNVSDHLLVRAAYARTLGRPNLSSIVPGTTISDPAVAVPTISVNNTGLKPWTADSFDLSLESYQFKDGFGSVGVFRKSIKNFFGALSRPATPELLEQYGLGGDSTLLNYTINTRTNAGDAEITGFEFGYRQSLTFLPTWASGFQVFANTTKLNLSGSNTADFTGFNPQTFAGGINFVRSRFFLKVTCNYVGETRGSLAAVNVANGIPAGTYNYQGKRTRWGFNSQYSVNRWLAVYGTLTDIGGFVQNLRIYAPTTPDYAKGQRRQELGFYTTVGVRGTF